MVLPLTPQTMGVKITMLILGGVVVMTTMTSYQIKCAVLAEVALTLLVIKLQL